mmetsp:Transcript_31553/g.80479  ORF Transcript_31553/g.80479 Transcript_31553/m.80479 type:complete len:214 (+) Transcript_31553:172-813(+)
MGGPSQTAARALPGLHGARYGSSQVGFRQVLGELLFPIAAHLAVSAVERVECRVLVRRRAALYHAAHVLAHAHQAEELARLSADAAEEHRVVGDALEELRGAARADGADLQLALPLILEQQPCLGFRVGTDLGPRLRNGRVANVEARGGLHAAVCAEEAAARRRCGRAACRGHCTAGSGGKQHRPARRGARGPWQHSRQAPRPPFPRAEARET